MYQQRLETIDVNDTGAQVTRIYLENNEWVDKGDLVCTVETTKVTLDIEAEKAGYIELLTKEGEKIKFGSIIFVIKKNKDDKVNIEKEPVEKNKDFVLTRKAEEYVINNNINLEEFKDKLRGKSLIKLKDIEEILGEKSESNKGLTARLVNNRKRIVIIGGGSSGEVVADILMDYPEYEVIGFVDDNPREGLDFYGIKVIFDNIRSFPYEYDKNKYDAVIISFGGDLKIKKEIFALYRKEGIQFINAIDKSARIGRNTKLGVGNVIGAQAYIGTSTEIGDNNWIAASVNIDHHNKIGSHNLFGPNFTSPGIVEIGDLNKFGANASLSNYVKIGNNNLIMNNVSIYNNIGDNKQIK